VGGRRVPTGKPHRHHPDIRTVGLDAYLADVDAGEALLADLLGPGQERVWKVFRYPYLRQGTDVPTRLALRKALLERHYRIAEVTIDFDDWAYNPTYVRCLRRGDTASIEALESMLLDAAISQLRWPTTRSAVSPGARCLTSCCCTPAPSTRTSSTGSSPATRRQASGGFRSTTRWRTPSTRVSRIRRDPGAPSSRCR
jgi:hypothetical protein